MKIVITINLPDSAPGMSRPGIPMAQVMREIAPVIERMNPLVSGVWFDRLSGLREAEWVVTGEPAKRSAS